MDFAWRLHLFVIIDERAVCRCLDVLFILKSFGVKFFFLPLKLIIIWFFLSTFKSQDLKNQFMLFIVYTTPCIEGRDTEVKVEGVGVWKRRFWKIFWAPNGSDLTNNLQAMGHSNPLFQILYFEESLTRTFLQPLSVVSKSYNNKIVLSCYLDF